MGPNPHYRAGGCMRVSGFRLAVGLGLLLLGASAITHADTVYLEQGSRLQGRIVTLDADELVLDTDFAGTLKLARDKVAGVATDKPVPMVLDRHRQLQLTGRLHYDAETNRQALESPQMTVAAGEGQLALTHVTAIRPRAAARLKRKNSIEEYTLPEYDTNETLDEPRWTGSARLGIDGKSGNTSEGNITAGISGRRSTGDTRLHLLAAAERSTSNGEETAADYLGEASYERDFSLRWYGYMEQSIERDRFQDYGVRSLTTLGPGYFVVRRRRLIFKLHGGIGYEHIRHYADPGHNDNEMVASGGWHYAQLFGRYLELTHDFDIYPQLSD